MINEIYSKTIFKTGFSSRKNTQRRFVNQFTLPGLRFYATPFIFFFFFFCFLWEKEVTWHSRIFDSKDIPPLTTAYYPYQIFTPKWEKTPVNHREISAENLNKSNLCFRNILAEKISGKIALFSYRRSLMVFHESLSESKSPKVTRILLSILDDINNAVV